MLLCFAVTEVLHQGEGKVCKGFKMQTGECYNIPNNYLFLFTIGACLNGEHLR